jgi:hypothetical protein
MISISGGVGSSSNTGLTMQLGTASLTTSGYSWGGSAGSSSGVSGVGATSTTSWTVGDVNTNAIYLSMRINNPNLAKYTFFEAQSWNEANGNSRSLSGVQASTTQFTGFQLAPGTGTLTGGVIRVYGYSNS